MIRRIVALALALIVASGDVSWASKLEGIAAPKLGPTVVPQVSLSPRIDVPGAELKTIGGAQLLPGANAAQIPTAALPQLQNASLPFSQDQQANVATQQAELTRRWDAASPGELTDESAVPVAMESAPSALASSSPSAPAVKSIPLPRTGLTRAGLFAGWGALAYLSSLTHMGSDRVAPTVLAVVLSFALSFMVMTFMGAMQDQPGGGSRGVEPKDRTVTDAERAETIAMTQTMAEEAGLAPIKTIKTIGTDQLNAMAGGGGEQGHEVRVYGGVLDLPKDQQESIMRHEMSHLRHDDSAWSAVHLFLLPVPAAIAMASGMIADARSYWALPFAVASLFAWGAVKKIDEYHADQYAAAKQGTAKPLIAAFQTMKARDAADKAVPPKNRLEALKFKFEDAWDKVAWIWRSHPSMDNRIKRLERLEK